MGRRRAAILFLALAIIAAGSLQGPSGSSQNLPGSPALAQAAHNIPRNLTLKYSDRKDRFKGKIKSQVADCLTGVVAVHRVESGPNPIVASGSAGSGGRWSASAGAPKGRYYATIDGFQAAGGYCPPVRSKTLFR